MNRLAKFCVGDYLRQRNTKEDAVVYEVIFVPPLDNYGVQSYLCECSRNGMKKSVSLKSEKDIEDKLVLC
jgi:hypothetical protein